MVCIGWYLNFFEYQSNVSDQSPKLTLALETEVELELSLKVDRFLPSQQWQGYISWQVSLMFVGWTQPYFIKTEKDNMKKNF